MSSLAPTTSNIFDLNLIYDKAGEFEYSLPRNVLEEFLSGKAFGRKEFYSNEELSLLIEDITELFQSIIEKNPTKGNLAIITAGSPGSGKTRVIRQQLEKNRLNVAYVCPDDVCLRNQHKTYCEEIKNGDGTPKAQLDAYNRWRPGSNAATHLILANLIREKYNFYFGTTSSSPVTYFFYKFLKVQGYQIKVIHVSAPDDVRWKSIKNRDGTFVQTTEQDIIEKGSLVPQRIHDTFLEHADEIEFYYRSEAEGDAILAATWIKNKCDTKINATITVIDPEQYKRVKVLHDASVMALNRPDLLWENTVESVFTVVQIQEPQK